MIQGLVKTSYIDYPGELSSVVFLGGCNLRCPYCHNAHLLKPTYGENHSWEDVLITLLKRQHLVKAVVISGGEPTLRPDLFDKIVDLKTVGFKVKLDTNGTRPQVIKRLLEDKLLDFVAIDIKANPDIYLSHFGATSQDILHLQWSLDLLKKSRVAHQVRTTLIKDWHSPDKLMDMSSAFNLKGDWVWQQFNYSQGNLVDRAYDTYPLDDMKELALHFTNTYLTITCKGLY